MFGHVALSGREGGREGGKEARSKAFKTLPVLFCVMPGVINSPLLPPSLPSYLLRLLARPWPPWSRRPSWALIRIMDKVGREGGREGGGVGGQRWWRVRRVTTSLTIQASVVHSLTSSFIPPGHVVWSLVAPLALGSLCGSYFGGKNIALQVGREGGREGGKEGRKWKEGTKKVDEGVLIDLGRNATSMSLRSLNRPTLSLDALIHSLSLPPSLPTSPCSRPSSRRFPRPT